MKISAYTYDNFFVHYSLDQNPDPASFAMHAHEQYELFCFLSGNATFWVEGTPYSLSPDDVMLFNIAESHKISVDPNTPYERIAILFTPCFGDQIDPAGQLLLPFTTHGLGKNNILHSSDFASRYWKSCLTNIFSENAKDRRLHILTNLLPLLNEISVAFNCRSEKNDTQNDLPQRVFEFINSNLSSDLSAESVAQEFFISKSFLFSLIRKTTGTTFWSYVTLKRLLKARQLLNIGMKPTKVFSVCGFKDYSTFYRAYVKQFHTSPKQDSENSANA